MICVAEHNGYLPINEMHRGTLTLIIKSIKSLVLISNSVKSV